MEAKQDVKESAVASQLPTDRNTVDSKTTASVEQTRSKPTVDVDDQAKATKKHQKSEKDAPAGTIPKIVWLIIAVEFCERFAYYGMFTVLTRYFTSLGLDEHAATSMYHLFVVVNYAATLPGAIIADSWLGRFKTIAIMSIAYGVGFSLLSSSAIYLSYNLTVIALMTVAFGSGGIKPCVSTYGADQLENKNPALITKYFAYFYMSINVGSMISIFTTPMIRSQSCMGMVTCYPLAFGIPAAAMWLSVIFFLVGSPFYKPSPPTENIICKAIKASLFALRQPKRDDKQHWLYRADTLYDRKFLGDVLRAFQILKVLLPLPLFWGLYEQQGSRWMLQSLKTNNNIFGYDMVEEQLFVVNPISIAVMIPLFTRYVYPLTTSRGLLVKAHHRMAVGGSLAALSFVISGVFELIIRGNAGFYSNEAHVTILNLSPCHMEVNNTIVIPALQSHTQVLWTTSPFEMHYTARFVDCNTTSSNPLSFAIGANPGNVTLGSLYSFQGKPHVKVKQATFKPTAMTSEVLPVALGDSTDKYTVRFKSLGQSCVHYLDGPGPLLINGSLQLPTSTYDVFVDKGDNTNAVRCQQVATKLNRLYLFSLLADENKCHLNIITTPHISILWQLVQIITIAIGEIMFSITGLEFSYSQAPESMKAIVSSFWTLTVAFGNFVVVIVESVRLFEEETTSYFSFAGMMVVVIGIFCLLFRSFKYTNGSELPDSVVTTLYSSAVRP